MSWKAYMPFTDERRKRLFGASLQNMANGYDGLAEVEWEDGSLSFRPVNWDPENSALVDDDGNMWFARGLGSQPKQMAGVPVWDIYAGNAGIISTEAALIADRERHQDVIDVGDGDEVPEALQDKGLKDAEEVRGEAAADGGAVDAAVYDLRPPEGYDGQAVSVREPDYFDPFPVTRSDAKQAVEAAKQAERDDKDRWMKGFIVGVLVFAGIWVLFTVLPWLLGQIGGGGGGGGVSVGMTLPFILAIAPRREDGIGSRVESCLETVAQQYTQRRHFTTVDRVLLFGVLTTLAAGQVLLLAMAASEGWFQPPDEFSIVYNGVFLALLLYMIRPFVMAIVGPAIESMWQRVGPVEEGGDE